MQQGRRTPVRGGAEEAEEGGDGGGGGTAWRRRASQPLLGKYKGCRCFVFCNRNDNEM